jgi:ADP-heptose:LPS heptosyltransferase
MCPAIDDILSIDRIGMRDGRMAPAVAQIFRLVAELRRRKFDSAVDCHGFRETNLLSWLSGAPYRLGLKRFDQSFLGFCFNQPPVIEDKTLHASESFLRIAERLAPATIRTPASRDRTLVIPAEEERWAMDHLPPSPFVALFVDAPVPERVWPLNRFAALADYITNSLGGSVVVLGASGEVSRIFNDRVCVLSNLSIARLAAVIARAVLLVSNDTGPMHLGPALQIPTLGIFSVGLPEHFRPMGPRDRYVQGNPIETVSLREVIDAADQIWRTSGRQDPRC